MRVFGRGLILSGLLSALATAPAGAAPILASGDSGVACDGVLGVANSSCSLFSLGTLTGTTTFDFDLEFGSDRDVALFEFSIDAGATFATQTLSTGLFPFLGLFSGETRTLYSYTDPVNGELQAQGFERLEGVSLAGGSAYYLAVLLYPNGFGGTATSLLEPFACDGIPNDCTEVSGNFALSLQTISDEQPAAVPEPGTLALFGSGALAALVRRRSRKRG
jgi:hypothetical protein